MKPTAAVSSALAAVGMTWVTTAARSIPSEIGASRSKIEPYASVSPHYRDGRFHNTEPSSSITPQTMGSGDQVSLLRDVITSRTAGRPPGPVPLATPLAPAAAGDIAVTWFGHSSTVVEVDGHRVLTDPVWSNRVSPSTLVGPSRLHPVPAPLESLPTVDAVVISHDHYDHLDRATVLALTQTQDAPFVVPLGVGAHLRFWNVPGNRIIELDWNQSTEVGELVLTCTEARHFSGRGLSRDLTQWASWSIVGPRHKAFFGGDTGYTPRFETIGEEYGPFDVTLLPIGAYNPQWADIHMNPEEAVQAHADLQSGDAAAGVVLPIHWATFNLAFHPWAEPAERLAAAAAARGVATAVPMPGQRVDMARTDVARTAVSGSPGTDVWWNI